MTEPELPSRETHYWRAVFEWWHGRPFFSALVVMALIASVGWWRQTQITDRISCDESCLRSVVAAQIDRSATLSKLDAARTDAARRRQGWTTLQQKLFERALLPLTKAQAVGLRNSFKRALDGYLADDAQWQHLNSEYMAASKRQPVPKLSCNARNLNQPIPAVTRTLRVTSTMPAPKAKTIRPPASTVFVRTPGPTVFVPTTVTVAPRKGHHR